MSETINTRGTSKTSTDAENTEEKEACQASTSKCVLIIWQE